MKKRITIEGTIDRDNEFILARTQLWIKSEEFRYGNDLKIKVEDLEDGVEGNKTN